MAQALGVTEAALIAAAVGATGFPSETTALRRLLERVEAFTEIGDAQVRQSCLDLVCGKSSL